MLGVTCILTITAIGFSASNVERSTLHGRWLNDHCLPKSIGCIPPVEAEANYGQLRADKSGWLLQRKPTGLHEA